MDLSILIRTITAGRGWWQAPVGGGVVAPSIPAQEYQETLDKAEIEEIFAELTSADPAAEVALA